MRPLIIGPAEKAAIAEVVAYAAQPEHYYRVGSSPVPGHNPHFVVHVPDGFRCVFTFTSHGGRLFRHLTVSVPERNRRPSPEAIIMLAREFGFTVSGPPEAEFDLTARMERDRWLVSNGHEGEHCIVAVQPFD